MSERYAVMLECRAGIRDLIGDAWVDRYQVITWTVEDDLGSAIARVTSLNVSRNQREVRRVWLEHRR